MINSKRVVWFIWLLASVFYAYQYILRVMPNVMLNDLMQQFSMDPAVFGQFSGIYYIGYSLMHLPLGILIDRLGPRKVMTVCILLTVIGLMPIIFAKNWIYPVMGRALIGIGSSAAILGVFKIIRMLFREERFTRMLGFSVTIGLIGAIYGGGPVNYMVHLWGYQTVVLVFAAIGLMLAGINFFIVPDMPSDHQSTVLSDLKAVFTNRKVLLLCVSAGMMVGPLEGFADVWGSAFLKHIYGIDAASASYFPSLIFVGMCLGSSALSLIAEKSGYYIGTIIAAASTMFIIFTLLVAGKLSISSIAVNFILIGVCCAYQIIAIYKASTYVEENIAGLTIAVANTIIMSFGYAFHSTIGYVINASGGANAEHAFSYGMSVIPITLLIGVLGFVVLGFMDKYQNKYAIAPR